MDPVRDEPPITVEDRQHWSFAPLLRPALPPVQHPELVRNEIDQFILARLEESHLQLSPQADPVTLIRRVTFDLTGLPPSAQLVQDFVRAVRARSSAASAQNTADPYETLVDQLLASPAYGEKFAQHWLDLARYADSDGFEHDLERKEAWKYRDWVIGALNQDMPYDDFVAFQIAGDEMSPKDGMATGFLFAGPDMPESNFQDERRHLLLNDIAGTFGTALLGLTVGCAQCHDHPYDPVSQADFYRLRAFFDNLPPLKKDHQLGPMMSEVPHKSSSSRVCIRGDFERPGPAVKPAFLRVANPAEIEPNPAPAAGSSGQRTALARWVTQPANGLFLRAAVNRLWQQHFGRALAATTNDLGNQGAEPTHLALLNWLATELPRRRWSLKQMHKLIVMSATYRQQGATSAPSSAEPSFEQILQATAERDPSNDLLAFFPRRRLTGEELRDAMMAAANRLKDHRGGPGVHLPLPPELTGPVVKKKNEKAPDPADYDCRSIYVFARRNLRYPLFDVFDKPDALLSCSRRNESVTAPQALILFNSAFSQEMARSLAADLLKSAGDPSALVTAANWRCYCRQPTAREFELGAAFLQKRTASGASLAEALADYCLALLNANAFCYVD